MDMPDTERLLKRFKVSSCKHRGNTICDQRTTAYLQGDTAAKDLVHSNQSSFVKAINRRNIGNVTQAR